MPLGAPGEPQRPQADEPPSRGRLSWFVGWLAIFDRNRPVWLGMLIAIATISSALLLVSRPVLPPRDGHELEVPRQVSPYDEPTQAPPAVSGETGSPEGIPISPQAGVEVRAPEPGPGIAALPPPEPTAGKARGRVALVMDDVGWLDGIVQQLRPIDPAISLAILPFAPYSRQTAEQAHGAGMEVLVHVPMEPHDPLSADAEDGMLLSSMRPADMTSQLRRCIEAVPYAVGVNNHMGSRLTEDEAAMAVVMEGLRELGLFFLDSVTSPRSIAYDVARELEVPVSRRDVFLDSDPSLDAIVAKLAELGELARREGWAVGIAHPYAVTFEALHRGVPRLRQGGLEIVPVSRLVE